MKVPAKFPPGCRFVPTFGGDDFVEFPDGKVFKFSDDGLSLKEATELPRDGICIRDTPPNWVPASKAKS